MLLVLNSFIKNLLMTKARACKFDLVKGQAYRPYKRTGIIQLVCDGRYFGFFFLSS